MLIIGGGGYIGSHTCACLLESGWQVIGIDNLCNSSPRAIERVQQITDRALDELVVTGSCRFVLHILLLHYVFLLIPS